MFRTHTLARPVYEHLLHQLFADVFIPGSPPREVELAAELGVCRTPVLPALGRLAEYELVETRANHRKAEPAGAVSCDRLGH